MASIPRTSPTIVRRAGTPFPRSSAHHASACVLIVSRRCLCVGSKARSHAAGGAECRVPQRRERQNPWRGRLGRARRPDVRARPSFTMAIAGRARRPPHAVVAVAGRARRPPHGGWPRNLGEWHCGPDGPSCLTTNTQTGSHRRRCEANARQPVRPRGQTADTGIDQTPFAIGSVSAARQTIPPCPAGTARFPSVAKCRASPGPGDAVFLNSSG